MRKKALWSTTMVAWLVLFGSNQILWAGPWMGLKVGVVDMSKIMSQSKTASDARGMFLMEIESKKSVLKTKEREIRAMERSLSTPEAGSKDSASNKEKKDEVARAVKDLKRLRDDMEEELKTKERELTDTLHRQISEIVQTYLKQEKYSLILEKKTVMAFDEALDITDTVMELYDKRR